MFILFYLLINVFIICELNTAKHCGRKLHSPTSTHVNRKKEGLRHVLARLYTYYTARHVTRHAKALTNVTSHKL